MEQITFPVFVLFELAKWWPPAHRAFLANKHYRKQYDNKGSRKEILNAEGAHWEARVTRNPYMPDREHRVITWKLRSRPHSFFPSCTRFDVFMDTHDDDIVYENLTASWACCVDVAYAGGDERPRHLRIEMCAGCLTIYTYNGRDLVGQRCISNDMYAPRSSWWIPLSENELHTKEALAYRRSLTQFITHVCEAMNVSAATELVLNKTIYDNYEANSPYK